MKISVEQAVTYILAVPAHRSSNESHQRLGNAFYDQLVELSKSDHDPSIAEYNAEVLGIVNSAVRMFSVIRDKIQHEWNELETIKAERETLIRRIRLFSPLEERNYFTKTVAILTPVVVAFNLSALTFDAGLFTTAIFVSTVGLDVVSNLFSFMVLRTYKKKALQERTSAWNATAQAEYRRVISKVVADLCQVHNRIFPDEGIQPDQISQLQKSLIERKFYA